MEPAYPTLTRRYLSSLIDGFVLLASMIGGSVLLQGDSSSLVGLRVSLIVGLLLNYEPILTSKAATVGQLMTGIRVRQFPDSRAGISLGRAYLRTLVKVVLGFYSFFAIGFKKERRAVHDLVAKSIVLEAATLR